MGEAPDGLNLFLCRDALFRQVGSGFLLGELLHRESVDYLTLIVRKPLFWTPNRGALKWIATSDNEDNIRVDLHFQNCIEQPGNNLISNLLERIKEQKYSSSTFWLS